jgi:hypothetical protein
MLELHHVNDLFCPFRGAFQFPIFERPLFAGDKETFGRRGQHSALLFERFGNRAGGITAFIHQEAQGSGVDGLQHDARVGRRRPPAHP